MRINVPRSWRWTTWTALRFDDLLTIIEQARNEFNWKHFANSFLEEWYKSIMSPIIKTTKRTIYKSLRRSNVLSLEMAWVRSSTAILGSSREKKRICEMTCFSIDMSKRSWKELCFYPVYRTQSIRYLKLHSLIIIKQARKTWIFVKKNSKIVVCAFGVKKWDFDRCPVWGSGSGRRLSRMTHSGPTTMNYMDEDARVLIGIIADEVCSGNNTHQHYNTNIVLILFINLWNQRIPQLAFYWLVSENP